MPNIRWLIALQTRVHRFVYLLTGGRLGSRIFSMRFLLLYTVGRKTGLERITPLLCIPEAGRWLVAGSNGGDDRPPAWLLNLQARPEARVGFGTEEQVVKAREASDEEAVELWPRLEASYAYFASYRERTVRKIPVVILETAR